MAAPGLAGTPNSRGLGGGRMAGWADPLTISKNPREGFAWSRDLAPEPKAAIGITIEMGAIEVPGPGGD